jgi:hypothetical protein
MDLIGDGAVNHIEVLLAEDYVRFLGREQLCLGRRSYHEARDNGAKRFDWQ